MRFVHPQDLHVYSTVQAVGSSRGVMLLSRRDVSAVVILANGRTTRNPAGAEAVDPYINLNHD
jgi:hypothetical protein